MHYLKNIPSSFLGLAIILYALCMMFLSFEMLSQTSHITYVNYLNKAEGSECLITKDTTKKEVFKVVESMPRFPGCEHLGTEAEKMKCAQREMLQFIYENIEYPKEARLNSVEGTVVIRFIVKKDGSFENVEAVRKIGAGCDEESVRVINTMPKWIPGKQRGKPIKVQFNLPIKFKLDKKTLKENKKRDKKNKKKG